MLAQLYLLADDLLRLVHRAVDEPADGKDAAHDGTHVGEEVQERGALLLDVHLCGSSAKAAARGEAIHSAKVTCNKLDMWPTRCCST